MNYTLKDFILPQESLSFPKAFQPSKRTETEKGACKPPFLCLSQIRFEGLASGSMPQSSNGLFFNLPDTLTGQIKFLANFF